MTHFGGGLASVFVGGDREKLVVFFLDVLENKNYTILLDLTDNPKTVVLEKFLWCHFGNF